MEEFSLFWFQCLESSNILLLEQSSYFHAELVCGGLIN